MLVARWGVIKNGGQNSNALPVPLTPIQIHTSILPPPLCLHNWLQAFGIHHISWNPICKQRTAAAEKQSSPFLTHRYSPCTQKPGGRAQSRGKRSNHTVPNVKLSHVGSDTMLSVLEWVKPGGKDGELFSWYLVLMRLIWDREKERRRWERTERNTKRSKQERTSSAVAPCSLHCQIIFTPQLFCPDRVMDSRGDFAWAWK